MDNAPRRLIRVWMEDVAHEDDWAPLGELMRLLSILDIDLFHLEC
jgi:hypothetical protein